MGLKELAIKLIGDPRERLLARMPKNAVVAEIGVWKGDFSQLILDRTSPRELHLIDPWAFQTDFGERLFGGLVAQSQDDMDAIFQGVQERFKDYRNVKYDRRYSSEAFAKYDDNFFDWVYIDGNHYYDFVLADLKNFYSKIRSGGYLVGDDYKWTSHELNGDLPVKRAVQDFVRNEASAKLVSTYGGQFAILKSKI